MSCASMPNLGTGLLRVLKAVFWRNDTPRWRRTARQVPTWDRRNEILAGFIPAGSSVLDLGAGAQTLRGHLRSGCEYQPCDLVASSEDVLLCDFNAGVYPPTTKAYDYVVCSGVLEYIRQPEEFLDRAASLGRTVLLSYVHFRPGRSRLWRLAHGWVNHLTCAQIEACLGGHGLRWKRLLEWNTQAFYAYGTDGDSLRIATAEAPHSC